MVEEPSDIVLVKLEEIRKEQARTNENVGGLASAIVSMKREFQRELACVQRDLTSLKGSVTALVVAVDDHTRRLDAIDIRLEQIEKKLDRTHA
jgi:hypothetical protein